MAQFVKYKEIKQKDLIKKKLPIGIGEVLFVRLIGAILLFEGGKRIHEDIFFSIMLITIGYLMLMILTGRLYDRQDRSLK